MGVRALHHAGVYVSNLERSIGFYGGAFGLEVAERLSFDGEEIAFLSVGLARLELIESTRSARPLSLCLNDEVNIVAHCGIPRRQTKLRAAELAVR